MKGNDRVLFYAVLVLIVALVGLFLLSYNTYNIILDDNYNYCVGVTELTLEGQKIMDNEVYCSEGTLTLAGFMDIYSLNIVLYGMIILDALVLFLISFMVVFTKSGSLKIFAKSVLIVSLLFAIWVCGLFSMVFGGELFSTLFVAFAILAFINGILILNFDKNETKKFVKVVMIILSIVVYAVTLFFVFFAASIPKLSFWFGY